MLLQTCQSRDKQKLQINNNVIFFSILKLEKVYAVA